MKKKILLYGLLFCRISLAQNYSESNVRIYEQPGISTIQAIINFSDSMRLSYPYYDISMFSLDTDAHQVTYWVYPDRISVSIPVTWDEPTLRSLYQVIDSLSRTKVYINLKIVNRISFYIVGRLQYKDYVPCKGCENTEMTDWQKELSIKTALLDLEYSARLIDTNGPSICNLPDFLYTPEIINRIRKLFQSPFLTREEAEIIAEGRRKPVDRLDTTGLEAIRKNLYRTDKELAHYVNTTSRLQNIQNRGQTIEQYADSLARLDHEAEINRWDGKLWSGCFSIIFNAGQDRRYSLAALIDSFATPEIKSKMYSNQPPQIPIIFARLKYKDYPRTQEEKYLHIMDSCILYLKNHPKLGKDSVYQTALTLRDCYDNLVYMDVPDVHFKLSPLLLITNKLDSQFRKNESVGSYFINERFMWDISNLSIPDIQISDWDSKNVPYKTYQWMQKNKDNYQLR